MMDKEKIKAVANEATSKTKNAMSEIKANFKADEGTTGFRKVQSMFVNLWKSGATGKGALIACSGVLFLLLIIFFGGSGKSGENEPMAAAARVQEETATAAARVQEKVAAVIARAQDRKSVV